MQDRGRQALQDTQQGLEDDVRRAQWWREKQQISLGVADRQHLGNLFAEHDVHHRHQYEGQTDREGVRNAGWRPKVRPQESQRLHHRVFGQPADPQAGDRDADLRQRQVVTDAIDHDDRTLGCFHALSGEFFESRPANPHDGELCRHPERIDEDEPERSCDEQNGSQFGIQHGGLLVVRSAIRGSNAGQRGKCPMAVVAWPGGLEGRLPFCRARRMFAQIGRRGLSPDAASCPPAQRHKKAEPGVRPRVPRHEAGGVFSPAGPGASSRSAAGVASS